MLQSGACSCSLRHPQRSQRPPARSWCLLRSTCAPSVVQLFVQLLYFFLRFNAVFCTIEPLRRKRESHLFF